VHIPGPLRLGIDPWGLSSDASIERALRAVRLGHLLDDDDDDEDDDDNANGHDRSVPNGGGGRRGGRGKAQRLGPLDRDLDPAALSHGQRQLLAAARAALQRAAQRSAVLLLDEAAGALDPAAEAAASRALRLLLPRDGSNAYDEGEAAGEAAGKCTVVCVSHRPATILAADMVAVMEAGEVVEVGPPRELMRVEGGRLRALLAVSGSGSGSG
jgi:ABC-type multidrug transport system fused ATPase/permease subunit